MDRGFVTEAEADAALEKALREGWITPEQVEEMRSRQPQAARPRRSMPSWVRRLLPPYRDDRDLLKS